MEGKDVEEAKEVKEVNEVKELAQGVSFGTVSTKNPEYRRCDTFLPTAVAPPVCDPKNQVHYLKLRSCGS